MFPHVAHSMPKGMARVLVVEDDCEIAAVVVEALKVAGDDAGSAGTGFAAMAACAAQCPDLVLLDQMLPDIDGVEVCRRLRSTPETSSVPIVFLTARTDEKSRVR